MMIPVLFAVLLLLVFAAMSSGGDKLLSWSDILDEGEEPVPLAGGFQFLEGPTWTPRGTLVFSDIPANTLYEYTGEGHPRVYRHPSHNANGNTLDPEGRIVTCEHGSRRVTRTEHDGSVTVLAERYEGKRLNSPNDVVVKSNGDVYFTDPPYGIDPDPGELQLNGVFLLTSRGELKLLCPDFDRPNGLAFSPDEKRLYIGDSRRKHIRVFDVKEDGTLDGGEVFAEMDTSRPGSPDGMRVDHRGNLYCTGSGGIHVWTPGGKHLGWIPFPEVPANCAWGDEDGKTLYVTARTGLYKIRTKIGGRKGPGRA